MEEDNYLVIIFVILFVSIIALNIYIYGFAKCNSFLMGIMPQREIPGRCVGYIK